MPTDKLIFSTNKYVTNGILKDITYIVYIDSAGYANISEYQDLIEVGRIIGKLNTLLPRRGFILIGPGRWGSRGDIKLGVRVTFADIRNTAMLIEVPFSDGTTGLDPSFGTHFFQDLMEASIRYLPLDTNLEDVSLNMEFLTSAENRLVELLQEAEQFLDVIKVIYIPDETEGKKIQILMNANTEQALALLVEHETYTGT